MVSSGADHLRARFDYAFGALEVGASGFLLKDVRAAQLAQAVPGRWRRATPCPRRASPRSSLRVGFHGLSGAQHEGCRSGSGVLTGGSTW